MWFSRKKKSSRKTRPLHKKRAPRLRGILGRFFNFVAGPVRKNHCDSLGHAYTPVNQEADAGDSEDGKGYADAMETVDVQDTVDTQETALYDDFDKSHPIAAQHSTASKQDQQATLILEKLPQEMLLEIMKCLPHSALYLLQQTCQTFRYLSKDQAFNIFNLEFYEHGEESYCITKSGHQQRQRIRDILARESHCDTCCAFRKTGRLDWEMRTLYEPMYCSGCKQNHPRLFFSPDQRSKTYAQCLGRVGNFTLCSHQSIAGPDMVSLLNIGKEDKAICKHMSHVPSQISGLDESFQHEWYFPRAKVSSSWGSDIRLEISKGAEILVLNHESDVNFQKLRADMEKVCRTLAENQFFCEHLCWQMEEFLDCLRSEGCYCFPSSGLPSHQRPYDNGYFCDEHTFSCRICKAKYKLQRTPGHIRGASSVTVEMTGRWCFSSFLSPGWLFNLHYNTDIDCDPRLKKNPLLDRSTKHVLWCDSPGCATGSGRRWRKMAQTYLYEHLVRGRRLFRVNSLNDEDAAEFWDLGWLSLEYDIFHNNDD